MTTLTFGRAEARINSTTALNQRDPSLAQMTDGSYVASWTNYASNGHNSISTQHFDASGNRLGGQQTVSAPFSGADRNSDVGALANGGYVVSWSLDQTSGTKYAVHAQRFGITGGKVGGDTIITSDPIYQQEFSQVAQWNGGYLSVWESNNAQPPTANGYGIHAVLTDSAGVVNSQDMRVNLTLLKDQLDPALATFNLANGVSTGFVSAFETPDSSGFGIVARTYDATATGAPAEFQVNTTQTGEQRDPATAVLTNGEIIVTWTSTGQDGSGDGVYLQHFTATGGKIGVETRVNSFTANGQAHSQIAALTDGGYVVVWDSVGQDGSGKGIYAQRYASDGARLGGETLVNSYKTGDQHDPAVSALGDGFVVSWTSAGQDGSGDGVYQKTFYSVDQTLLGAGNDTFTGVAGADSISGSAGSDRLDGSGGNDTIAGGDGNDTLLGGLGSDSLSGGVGNDSLQGGVGADTLSGGGGADMFHGYVGSGIDRITDFSLAEGDHIALNAGTGYRILHSGSDTIVDMFNGQQMVLVGVNMTAPDASWITFV